jgi:hypothetical protein
MRLYLILGLCTKCKSSVCHRTHLTSEDLVSHIVAYIHSNHNLHMIVDRNLKRMQCHIDISKPVGVSLGMMQQLAVLPYWLPRDPLVEFDLQTYELEPRSQGPMR